MLVLILVGLLRFVTFNDGFACRCSKYYEKDALLSDPVDGMILASLLGDCLRLVLKSKKVKLGYIIVRSKAQLRA